MQRLFLLVVIFCLRRGDSRNFCSNSKNTSKYVESFKHMSEEDIVIEGRYTSRQQMSFRFVLVQTWQFNNGGLDYMDAITINIDEVDPSIASCFEALTHKENYLLLLRRRGDSTTLIPQLAPLSIRKQSKREEVRKAWCELSRNECALKISRDVLPAMVELFPGMNTFLRCRIESKTRITEIRWLKDGKDITKDGGDFYAENGLFVRDKNLRLGTSDLVIYRAHSMHSGVYSCEATNAGGETSDLKTRVLVGDESNVFAPCPASASGYCHAESTCKTIVDLPNEIVCLCKRGRTGRRCHELSIPGVEEVSQDEKEMNKQIHELKVTTIVLGSVLGVSILLVLYLALQFRRARRKGRLPHAMRFDNEEKCAISDAEQAKAALQDR